MHALQRLLPLLGLLAIEGCLSAGHSLILIQLQQLVERRLHVLALAFAKFHEGQLAAGGRVQHLGHGLVAKQAELGHQAEAVASGGIVQIRRRGPAGYTLTEAVAPLAERVALLEYLLRGLVREPALVRQGQLGVVGLGFQLGDQVVEGFCAFFIQLGILFQQTSQRALPVRAFRPHQTSTEKTVQGRVGHVLIAVALDPLIEMTGTSGWIHRQFLWI